MGQEIESLVHAFASIRARQIRPKTRHKSRLPGELVPGPSEQRELPWPDVLILEEESIGNVFLYRLTAQGVFAGDTWHQRVEDAKYQAEFEYGSALGSWQPIPEDVDNPYAFALEALKGSRQTCRPAD